ncbi:MAG: NUDIX domain-containing protein [bacterium]
MSNICDHKSVGMFVWKEGKLLLIERAKFPFGFAVPAGHIDGDSTFEESAVRELKEEVGLEAVSLELILEERKENKCRREDGTWHYWKVYQVEVSGDLKRSEDETKRAVWYTLEEIKGLANKTEKYLNKEIADEDWNDDPGLETVMYEFLKELKII